MAYVRKKDRVKQEEKRDPNSLWWLPLLTKAGLADAKAFAKEWEQMPKGPRAQFTNMPERSGPKRKKSRKTT